jgi:leucyl-tRNA synthetase
MMEFVKVALAKPSLNRETMIDFLLILSPYAPHLAEELFELIGEDGGLAHRPWPKYDEAAIELDQIEIAIQVQGKLRASLQVSKGIDKDQLLSLAKEHPNVQKHMEGMEIVKEIVVPNRLVNLVVRPKK